MKKILLALCDELSKKKPDKKKISLLLEQAKISPSDDPYQITNEVLKKLHSYEDASKQDPLPPEKGDDHGQTL
ncbi:MAG TPA: hypothetical protein VJL87_02730 [Bdellovibrionota bacterium]|nr:hypothetical protein [Bdellovibrionota bacterium]